MRAQASGFAEASSGTLTLRAGTTATVQLQLQIASARAQVVVTGAVGEVRTDEPQLGVNLTGDEAQSLPLLNRRITWLPLVNAANRPAINQGDVFMNQMMFTANGTGRRQTWFEVDGANGNDMWGRQTIFTNVPLDAVREMTVLDNAFAADYGFGEGAVVNVVTRAGTRDFHGDVLGLVAAIGAGGGAVGIHGAECVERERHYARHAGPGGGDALGTADAVGADGVSGVGEYSYQDRASPVISPLAPGNYIGHYRDWLGLLRVDHRYSEGQRVFLHLGADSFFDTNPNGTVGGNNLPTVDRVFRRRTYTAEAGRHGGAEPVDGERGAGAVPAGVADYAVFTGDVRHAIRGADFVGGNVYVGDFAVGAAAEPSIRGDGYAGMDAGQERAAAGV